MATFACNADFHLVGDATATCTASLTWSGSRTCEPELFDTGSTYLQWQAFPPDGAVSLASAAGYCDALVLGGKSDFRLPTLLDLSSTYGETFRALPYVGSPSAEWTSTQRPGTTDVWTVETTEVANPVPIDGSSGVANVRCVRGTSPIGPTFRTPSNGTVVDGTTALMWQLASDGVARTRAEWLDFCAARTTPEGSDWRLPTAEEYRSLIGADGEYNYNVFPVSIASGELWASDTTPSVVAGARVTQFIAVSMLDDARCVRP